MSHVRQIGFIDLPSDVLLKILANCDVVDVLQFEITCKAFRDIVSTRHLWLTLLRGLPNEFAPDLVPHVSIVSLDCAHLKELVVRSVRKNRNWNSSSPKVTHELKVFVKEPTEGVVESVNEASIVPGGDYLMVRWSNHFIQLYRLSHSESIWSYPDSDSSSKLLASTKHSPSKYDVDRISEDVLRVLFVAFVNENAIYSLSIKVFEINLRQRRSEKIYDYQLANLYIYHLIDICFHGDYIVIKERQRGIWCFNWRTYGQSKPYPFGVRNGFTVASQLIKGFLFSVHLVFTNGRKARGVLRVASIQQAPEAASGQEGTSSLSVKSSILDTFPAVTKQYFEHGLFEPSTVSIQALNAFWRQEESIGVLVSCYMPSSILVAHCSFETRTRKFTSNSTAIFRMDADCPRYRAISSSRSEQILLETESGDLDGFDAHSILRNKPGNGLRRRVFSGRAETIIRGMDPYSGAILLTKNIPTVDKTRELSILYFD